MKQLKHKGYIGSVETSLEDNCLYGKIEFINDLVTYEAKTVEELKGAFIEAVEDYLETCTDLGQKPEKSFKGSLNVRLGADLHRQAALRAKQNGISINQLIVGAVENFLDLVEKEPSIHLHTHEHKYESKVPDWGIEISKGVSEWETTEALKH